MREIVKLDNQGRTKILSNKDKSFYFFPFYPALGFQNRGGKQFISEKLYNSIINGENPVILKWLGSEQALTWEDERNSSNNPPLNVDGQFVNKNLKRTLTRGEFFYGTLFGADFETDFTEKQTGFTTGTGDNVVYNEQTITKNFVIEVNEKEIKELTQSFIFLDENNTPDVNKLRLFFVCPELAKNDVLYISKYEPVFDPTTSEYRYSLITLTSLKETYINVNKNINTLISFGAPGEAIVFPKVSTEYYDTTKKENVVSVFEPVESDTIKKITGSKQFWMDQELFTDQKNQVAFFQIDFNGLAGVNSIMFIGGKQKIITLKGKKVIDHKIVPLPTYLFANEISYPFASLPADVKPEIVYHSVQADVNWLNWYQFGDKKDANFTQDYWDPNATKENIGTLIFEKDIKDIIKESESFILATDDDKKDVKFGGVRKLIYNPLSSHTIGPKYDKTNKVFDYDKYTNKNDTLDVKNVSIADILYKAAMTEIANHRLNPGSKEVVNFSGIVKGMFDKIFGWVPFVGQIAASFLKTLSMTNTLPAPTWDKKYQYWPGSKINLLLPISFLTTVASIRGPEKVAKPAEKNIATKHIPLSYFIQQQESSLKALLNTQMFPVSFFGSLTDRVKTSTGTFSTSELYAKDRLGSGTDPGTVVAKQDSEDSYIIYGVVIKALTRKPIRILFFNKDKELIREDIVKSQGQATGNIFEWNTTIDYFSFDDQNRTGDERYLGRAKADKSPEPVVDIVYRPAVMPAVILFQVNNFDTTLEATYGQVQKDSFSETELVYLDGSGRTKTSLTPYKHWKEWPLSVNYGEQEWTFPNFNNLKALFKDEKANVKPTLNNHRDLMAVLLERFKKQTFTANFTFNFILNWKEWKGNNKNTKDTFFLYEEGDKTVSGQTGLELSMTLVKNGDSWNTKQTFAINRDILLYDNKFRIKVKEITVEVKLTDDKVKLAIKEAKIDILSTPIPYTRVFWTPSGIEAGASLKKRTQRAWKHSVVVSTNPDSQISLTTIVNISGARLT